jgi:hypothetical protein
VQSFKTITSRYDGKCQTCGLTFKAGTRIRYGFGKAWHLRAECPQVKVEAEADLKFHMGNDGLPKA